MVEQQQQRGWRRASVPAFGGWDDITSAGGGAVPDYSLDFSRIRAARRVLQRGKALSWSAGGERQSCTEADGGSEDREDRRRCRRGRHRRQHSDATDARQPISTAAGGSGSSEDRERRRQRRGHRRQHSYATEERQPIRAPRKDSSLSMVAETESSDSLPGSSNATADKPVSGVYDQRSQEMTPKKNHKAEQEKLKRDQLNDLFLELSSMLDLEKQNSGKASVLGDAARVLRDLVTQVECLRKEQSALLAERQYVSSEKNELLEENAAIKARISELQNELRSRMGNNSISLISSIGMSHPTVDATNPGLATQPTQHQVWSSIPNSSTVAMTHSTNTVSPFHGQQQQHRPAVAGQVHASRPQELQLFPGTSSPPDCERSNLRISAPTSTSSLIADPLPGQLELSLPQLSQEGCSTSVSRRKNG